MAQCQGLIAQAVSILEQEYRLILKIVLMDPLPVRKAVSTRDGQKEGIREQRQGFDCAQIRLQGQQQEVEVASSQKIQEPIRAFLPQEQPQGRMTATDFPHNAGQ